MKAFGGLLPDSKRRRHVADPHPERNLKQENSDETRQVLALALGHTMKKEDGIDNSVDDVWKLREHMNTRAYNHPALLGDMSRTAYNNKARNASDSRMRNPYDETRQHNAMIDAKRAYLSNRSPMAQAAAMFLRTAPRLPGVPWSDVGNIYLDMERYYPRPYSHLTFAQHRPHIDPTTITLPNSSDSFYNPTKQHKVPLYHGRQENLPSFMSQWNQMGTPAFMAAAVFPGQEHEY